MDENKMKDNINKFLKMIDKLYENGIIDIFNQVNQSDFRILNFLLNNDNAFPSVIASNLQLTRSNTAAALKKLAENNFLTRETNQSNRRQIFVSLTDKGREYVNLCNKQINLILTGWFSSLSQKEIDDLFSIVEKALDPKSISSELKEFTFGG